jgi:hypothetical protein
MMSIGMGTSMEQRPGRSVDHHDQAVDRAPDGADAALARLADRPRSVDVGLSRPALWHVRS